MRHTALFCDTDNVITRSRENLGRAFDISEVIGRAGGHQCLLEARFYADSTHLPPSVRRQFVQHAILPLDVLCRTINGKVIKDRVDFKMTTDMLRVAFTRADVRRFVLVSGDGSFLHALTEIDALGKEVYILAVRGSVSADLLEFIGPNITYLQGGRVLKPVTRAAA